MREVKKGDRVIHITERSPSGYESFKIVGVSIVEEPYVEFEMPPNTEWHERFVERGERPLGYFIRLTGFQELNKPVSIDDIFRDREFMEICRQYI